ncbi:MAG: GNAT family N-acetyltransferase [Mobilicoccus sp.]|nr:GNAT family N-acetyltransferase [Mobilicoccus sp.]
MLEDLLSRDDLLAVVGDDAFARWDPEHDLRGWTMNGAVAVMRASAARPPSLFAWGEQVGGLLDALLTTRVIAEVGTTGVSVPWPQRVEVESRFTVTGGGDWDWMWTTDAGWTPDDVDLVTLDDKDDAEEIAALAAVENPRFEGFPGTGHSEQWLGARDERGALIACGAVQRLPAGTAHLGGILVATSHRRRGLGRAISAALTHRIVRGEGVCTLGMYADNDAARALYESLGYVVDKSWASRRIAPVEPR